jgi:hypothetical protein
VMERMKKLETLRQTKQGADQERACLRPWWPQSAVRPYCDPGDRSFSKLIIGDAFFSMNKPLISAVKS